MKIVIFFILVSVIFSSCMYRNYVRDNDRRCSIHQKRLKVKFVGMYYGYPDWGNSKFPHRRKTISLGCERTKHAPLIRFAKVLVCSDCTKGYRRSQKEK